MPPKKKPEVSKKTEQKKKEKVIEDKTFGIKNKKGAKQQKFIKTVQTQVNQGGPKQNRIDANKEVDKTKKKDEKKKLQDEINALFKPVAQTVGKGVDPKSVLCAFFKQGQCGKGDKCKFSHDLNIERKQEKRSIYEDKKDEMEDMDEAQLEELVNKKHGETDKLKPKTSLICKHFLEAVENSKYGWFWECPNGAKCIYRHALPPGFVLKKDQKKEEKEDQISIEDLVETERAALGANVTKVTLESFLKWKAKKKQEKLKNLKADTEKKKAEYKAGRVAGVSGRQMFEFNPDLIKNDDDECQDGVIEREIDEDDSAAVHDITVDSFAAMASEVDNSGTQATDDRLAQRLGNGTVDGGESAKLDQAAALPVNGTKTAQEETDYAIAAALSATINGEENGGLEIDEDLFAEVDDDLIDELETLELEEEEALEAGGL